MNIKQFCDDLKQEPCMTPEHCNRPCHHDFTALRKVKPYPEVPPDTFVMLQQDFEDISSRLLWASVAFLAVMVANLLLALYILMRML